MSEEETKKNARAEAVKSALAAMEQLVPPLSIVDPDELSDSDIGSDDFDDLMSDSDHENSDDEPSTDVQHVSMAARLVHKPTSNSKKVVVSLDSIMNMSKVTKDSKDTAIVHPLMQFADEDLEDVGNLEEDSVSRIPEKRADEVDPNNPWTLAAQKYVEQRRKAREADSKEDRSTREVPATAQLSNKQRDFERAKALAEKEDELAAQKKKVSKPTSSKSVAFELLDKRHWQPDAASVVCMLCTNKFSVVKRRHHCRTCGLLVCSSCSSTRLSVPKPSGGSVSARVCDKCIRGFVKLGQK